MKKNLEALRRFFNRVLVDDWFFIFALVVFAIHTIWLALSAYSLPFDEYYHLGIIKFYSHQWSPFITHQPASVSYLGDITRLPSYLYEYLMSFPYRFFAALTSSQYVITVLMRGLNIAIVIFGLWLWRRFLLKIGLSRRLTNLTLIIFMLLPLVVLVAAENNYDNLMFMLTPIFLGFAYNLTSGRLTIKNLIGFVSVGLITCLVKDQFVVIFGLTGLLVAIRILRRHSLKAVFDKLWTSLKTTRRLTLVGLALLTLVSVGLFTERYGLNFVRYHSVDLDCAQVQPFDVCYQYSPWQRNYNTLRDKSSTGQLYGNPASYTIDWVTEMMRGFNANFANVPSKAQPNDPNGNYEFAPIMPLMIGASYVVLVATIVGLAVSYKKWRTIRWLRLSLLFVSVYIVILWIFNYSSYLKYGQAYAIQPRYLYPILIILLACCCKVVSLSINNRRLGQGLALLFVVIYLYSGGAFGWFTHANSGWYWPNQTVIKVNQNLKPALRKVILHWD